MTPQPTTSIAGVPLTLALQQELDVLHRSGLHRSLVRIERLGGAEVRVNGWPAIDFRLADAAGAVLHGAVSGVAASRSISGNHSLHEAQEARLAEPRLLGAERCRMNGSTE
jgi:7-keto-8-aminopelargonate synthetase-like enzyme